MLLCLLIHRRQHKQDHQTDPKAAEHIRGIVRAEIQAGKCNQRNHDSAADPHPFFPEADCDRAVQRSHVLCMSARKAKPSGRASGLFHKRKVPILHERSGHMAKQLYNLITAGPDQAVCQHKQTRLLADAPIENKDDESRRGL